MYHDDFCAEFLPRDGAVLDIGAGRGSFMVEMARRGYRVFGVETNPEYIEESRKRAAEADVFVDVRAARAEELPFPDDSFDFVNCAEVTEHVDDPETLCREIARVLRPGGFAYASFHNRFGVYDYHYHLYFINWIPRRFAEWLLALFRRHKEDSSAIGRQKLISMHYFRFSAVKALAERVGLRVTDIRIRKINKRFGPLAPVFLAAYALLLRPLYFNTFHILLQKECCEPDRTMNAFLA